MEDYGAGISIEKNRNKFLTCKTGGGGLHRRCKTEGAIPYRQQLFTFQTSCPLRLRFASAPPPQAVEELDRADAIYKTVNDNAGCSLTRIILHGFRPIIEIARYNTVDGLLIEAI